MADLTFASETDWFAVDSRGYLAIFASSFGPVPSRIARQDDVALKISAYLLALPMTSTITSHHAGLGGSDFTELACRGVFAFAWSDYDGPYLKIVAPNEPIKLTDFPPMTEVLPLPVLPVISFHSADRVATADIEIHEWGNTKRC